MPTTDGRRKPTAQAMSEDGGRGREVTRSAGSPGEERRGVPESAEKSRPIALCPASPRPLVWAILCLGAATGCGTKPPVPLEPVLGQVTFYGRPVVAELLFQPIKEGGAPNGRPSYALSTADGRYTARFTPEFAGAVPGKHRVTVTVFPFADEGEPQSLDEATRPFRRVALEREVRPGRNEFHFLLTF